MSIPENLPWRATGRTLGAGGQGQVHLVTRNDDPEGVHFALKELRNTGSSQARERFQREIEAVKRLNHPSIIRILDHSSPDDAYHYYVMEYHEGAKDLEKILFSGSNPYEGNVEACLSLFEQIIGAIAVCERSNPPIVHRDISPKNLLVLADGTVSLIDFGICQIQDGALITLTDENVGARNYTSPECEFGEDADVGIYSDIYSAAKVLWSAITSKRAFAREEPVFGSQSMERIFPSQPDTWFLMNIFERTIRRRPTDRWMATSQVLAEVAELRYLLRRGFPHPRMLGGRCPSCGSNSVRALPEGYILFGNPNPQGFLSLTCSLCGFCFVRNQEVWIANVNRMQGLN